MTGISEVYILFAGDRTTNIYYSASESSDGPQMQHAPKYSLVHMT
jgi:hypothetical protein